MTANAIYCFSVHCKPFRGARSTKALGVSVHAHSKAEAKRLYGGKGYSLKGIEFKKNGSCTTSHMKGCESKHLVAFAEGLEDYVPTLPPDYIDKLVLVKDIPPDRERARKQMMDGQHFD